MHLQVFSPLFQQLEEFQAKIPVLNVPCIIMKASVQSSHPQPKGPVPHPRKSRKRLAARRRRRRKKHVYSYKSLLCRANVPSDQFQLDNTNTVHSIHCKHCKKSSTSVSTTHCANYSFKSCEVVHGGDWGYLQALLQYTGANGVFFCPLCHVRLADLKKGVPHAPVTLSKYNAQDHRQPEEKTFTS